MNTIYSSKVTSKGGLYGHISSEDNALDIDVYMPTGTQADQPKGSTPEQLFAASYAACLEGTLYHIAKLHQVEISNTEVSAKVNAVQVEKGDLRFSLDMDVVIPEVDREKAQKLLDDAYRNCPLTKATSGNMEVNVNLR
ncbi:osmotically inducible protein OsmC [Catalinimonas alkaloidigena]|uniref:Ohr family peroxiredoxin n=1 Tax=Catalinimonas alkaloidigena TaxID=1075417 RepID=UPI00240647E8|nr:Ohr family peroxiredoxin [Catalinimonas alkaloidigena]MDF9795871.1 osmotically inducible protein OsmC [Catalinimonas alkaloidigena]